jgi:hypothetical protein
MSASAAAFTESGHRATGRWYRPGRQPATGLEGDEERRLPTRRRGSQRDGIELVAVRPAEIQPPTASRRGLMDGR